MNNKLPDGNYFIDLHLHADGALSVDTVLKLADILGKTLPTYDRDELSAMLSAPVDCADLNEYLERFALPCSLMVTKETVAEAFYRVKEEMRQSGLIYAELRFAPQLHLSEGMTQEEVVLAALEGSRRSELKSNLILCCMRGSDNKAENMETIRLAEKYRGKGVCAVDLAGAEALFKTADFEELFAYAKSLGLRYTIHAGEADGPDSVNKALDFGAERIGHGIRSAADDALLKRLCKDKVPLEVCITSNLQTKAACTIEIYPLRKLMESGVSVTLNTDNPTVSATTVRKEFELAKLAFSLTNKEVKALLLTSAESAFADSNTKKYLKDTIEAAFA